MKEKDDSVLEGQLPAVDELFYIPSKLVVDSELHSVEVLDSALWDALTLKTPQPIMRYRMHLGSRTEIQVWTGGKHLYFPARYETECAAHDQGEGAREFPLIGAALCGVRITPL